MLNRAARWLPALALLAGCSSRGYERQALTELTQRYGGEATLQSGYNLTTRPHAPRAATWLSASKARG